MKVMITGASGFIGAYLTEYLLKRNFQVIACARDISRLPEWFDYHNLDKRKLDILNQAELSQFGGESLDWVIHTATSNDILSRDTSAGITLSAIGTKNMLDFCVANQVPNLMFFSTFQVYGTELNGKIDELSPLLCQNDYGLNHIFGEQYVEMYARQGKINGVVVRPSNVYGRFSTPHINRWTLVPGCFCKEAYEKQTITLLSSGNQTRNFVSLENLSEAVNSIISNFKSQYDIFNISSTQHFSMVEVAQLTQNIYFQRYGKPVKLIIKSTNPPVGNHFEVSLQKLISTGFQESLELNLVTEINELFNHLEQINSESK